MDADSLERQAQELERTIPATEKLIRDRQRTAETLRINQNVSLDPSELSREALIYEADIQKFQQEIEDIKRKANDLRRQADATRNAQIARDQALGSI